MVKDLSYILGKGRRPLMAFLHPWFPHNSQGTAKAIPRAVWWTQAVPGFEGSILPDGLLSTGLLVTG